MWTHHLYYIFIDSIKLQNNKLVNDVFPAVVSHDVICHGGVDLYAWKPHDVERGDAALDLVCHDDV